MTADGFTLGHSADTEAPHESRHLGLRMRRHDLYHDVDLMAVAFPDLCNRSES